MYACDLTREELIALLPPGGEVAEIGVAEGTLSREILLRCAPRRLHLVDPWEHQSRESYKGDLYGNVADDEQNCRHRSVVEAFEQQIQTGQVVVHRAYSTDACERFSDGQLDWVYIDAAHSTDAVRADLRSYAPKVKEGGFIVGHDYTNHLPARSAGFGVVEAVNGFVAETGWRFLAVTMENFPTYLLAPERHDDAAEQLRLRLLQASRRTIEIRSFPHVGRFEHHALDIGGRTVVYQSY